MEISVDKAAYGSAKADGDNVIVGGMQYEDGAFGLLEAAMEAGTKTSIEGGGLRQDSKQNTVYCGCKNLSLPLSLLLPPRIDYSPKGHCYVNRYSYGAVYLLQFQVGQFNFISSKANNWARKSASVSL